MKKCPYCNTMIKIQYKMCGNCSAKLKLIRKIKRMIFAIDELQKKGVKPNVK